MTTRKFAFRIRESDYKMLKAKAKRGNITMTDLIISAVTDKEIIVKDDLNKFLSELKAIGRNLNQLAMLAHQNKISVVYLNETDRSLSKLYDIYNAVDAESGVKK